MIGAIINLIIYLLILGILYYLFVYVVDSFIPEPPQKMLKVAAIVVLCIVVILLLLDLIGSGTGVNLPKLTVD
jgi:H+/Cl- antiporter ClcA